jgi:hypothetical protein
MFVGQHWSLRGTELRTYTGEWRQCRYTDWFPTPYRGICTLLSELRNGFQGQGWRKEYEWCTRIIWLSQGNCRRTDEGSAFIFTPLPWRKWAGIAQSVQWLATGWTTEGSEFESNVVKNFHFSMSSRLALGFTQPRIQWVPGLFLRGWSGRGVTRTTDLQLVPRSRKCWSIYALPHTPSSCA